MGSQARAEARRARADGAFHDDFEGREEPDIYEILECARPYLPREGAFGEMVLNVGKAVYLAKKGAAGIIDISPFTCMNGIVCEAIYPQISRDLGGIPIRNFYFDGTQSDLDRDLGVYMELARSQQFQRSKAAPRKPPLLDFLEQAVEGAPGVLGIARGRRTGRHRAAPPRGRCWCLRAPRSPAA